MEIRTVGSFPIADSSHVAEIRRVAARTAQKLEFREAQLGKLAIVGTELATNVLKHGGGGEIILNIIHPRAGGCALELLALDKGRGIPDIGRSLQDGYSTSGSPGTGLGAVQRLSSAFEIYSNPGGGTAVLARVWGGAGEDTLEPVPLGAISVRMPGESDCGDDWNSRIDMDRRRLFLADGLGHGRDAAEAARKALETFVRYSDLPPAHVLEAVHAALRPTRGAAVALADIDLTSRSVRYAGVGNVAGVVVSPDSRDINLVSHNGTMGHAVRKIQEFQYAWPRGAILIMHTDGLSRRWSLKDHAGLSARSAALIAGVLFREARREHDDATVIALKDAD